MFVFNSPLSLRNREIPNLADGNFFSLFNNFPVLWLMLELDPFFLRLWGEGFCSLKKFLIKK